MANIINGDNGVVSGTAGLKSSSDGTGILALQTNGTTAVTVDASQNVGIGTTSPATKLDVNGNIALPNATALQFKDSGGTRKDILQLNASSNVILQSPSASIFQINGSTEAMRIDSSGNVGIGTTTMNGRFNSTPKGTYNPGGTTWTESALNTAGSYGGGLSMIDGTAGYGLNVESSGGVFVIRQGTVGSSPTERMRIDSSGNLLLNTTTVRNSARFTIDYNGASAQGLVLNNTDTGSASQLAMQFYRGATPSVVGQITTTNSATAYVTSSDYRLKESITPITGALAKVSALKPVTYKWKIDGSDSDGFIAHELAEVCPQAVYGEKDTVNADGDIVPQGIDTSFLVATLTAAIQELKALTDTQASTITALTARITALEAK